MIFPWQQRQWHQIQTARVAQRLPHALLLSGVSGMGKQAFADHLLASLLCRHATVDGDRCGQCHDCHLVQGGTHPNYLKITPENPGQAIKVDQVRLATAFVQQSALLGEYRIVVFTPAHALNLSAANALLKTLEEPPAAAILILLTDRPGSLPATIRSRCQSLVFPQPPQKETLIWLASQLKAQQDPAVLLSLSYGAPLAALALAEKNDLSEREQIFQVFQALSQPMADPLKLAERLQGIHLSVLLQHSISWLMAVMQLRLGSIPRHPDYVAVMQPLVARLNLKAALTFLDYLQLSYQQVSSGIHLNPLLLIEDVCFRWINCLQNLSLKRSQRCG